MSASGAGLWRPGIIFGLAILLASRFAHSAPVYDQDTTQIAEYNGDSSGCYYNYKHYHEGDRIITNEPCLNCTCSNRMLMCYLKVCPFTKPIGQNCVVEKRPDQCCPSIHCPTVPVQLLTSTTSSPSREVGFVDTYGCNVNDLFYADGAQLPINYHNPCELCYCIRNKTTCLMQQCTLHVAGCKPIYQPGICCPVKYDCDYDDKAETTVRPTPGLIMTTTIAPGSSAQCFHKGKIYEDGERIYSTEPCQHCYCFHGDIACAIQDCGTPMQKHGRNCTALPPPEGECCTTTYQCESDMVEGTSTLPGIEDKTTESPEEKTQQSTETYPGADNVIPEHPAGEGTESPDIESTGMPSSTPSEEREVTETNTTESSTSIKEGTATEGVFEKTTEAGTGVAESQTTEKSSTDEIEATTKVLEGEDFEKLSTTEEPGKTDISTQESIIPSEGSTESSEDKATDLETKLGEPTESTVVTDKTVSVTTGLPEEEVSQVTWVTEKPKEEQSWGTEKSTRVEGTAMMTETPQEGESTSSASTEEKEQSTTQSTVEEKITETVPKVTESPEMPEQEITTVEDESTSQQSLSTELPVKEISTVSSSTKMNVEDGSTTSGTESSTSPSVKEEEADTTATSELEMKPVSSTEGAIYETSTASEERTTKSEQDLTTSSQTKLVTEETPSISKNGSTPIPIVDRMPEHKAEDKDAISEMPMTEQPSMEMTVGTTEPQTYLPPLEETDATAKIHEESTTISQKPGEVTESSSSSESVSIETELPTTAQPGSEYTQHEVGKATQTDSEAYTSVTEPSSETPPALSETVPEDDQKTEVPVKEISEPSYTETYEKSTTMAESSSETSSMYSTSVVEEESKPTIVAEEMSTESTGASSEKPMLDVTGSIEYESTTSSGRDITESQTTDKVVSEQTMVTEGGSSHTTPETKETSEEISEPVTEHKLTTNEMADHTMAPVTAGPDTEESGSTETIEQSSTTTAEPSIKEQPETPVSTESSATEQPVTEKKVTETSTPEYEATTGIIFEPKPTDKNIADETSGTTMEEKPSETSTKVTESELETTKATSMRTTESTMQDESTETTKVEFITTPVTEKEITEEQEITEGMMSSIAPKKDEAITEEPRPSEVTSQETSLPDEESSHTTTEKLQTVNIPDLEVRPPSGIPGEGNCLVDGRSYNNNSDIPPANPCQLSCHCISSIVHCELVRCEPPPTEKENCEPVKIPGQCCPMYTCESKPDKELESGSHMMDHETMKPEEKTEEPTTAKPTEVSSTAESMVTDLPSSSESLPEKPTVAPESTMVTEKEKEVKEPFTTVSEVTQSGDLTTPVSGEPSQTTTSKSIEMSTTPEGQSESSSQKLPEEMTTEPELVTDKAVTIEPEQTTSEIKEEMAKDSESTPIPGQESSTSESFTPEETSTPEQKEESDVEEKTTTENILQPEKASSTESIEYTTATEQSVSISEGQTSMISEFSTPTSMESTTLPSAEARRTTSITEATEAPSSSSLSSSEQPEEEITPTPSGKTEMSTESLTSRPEDHFNISSEEPQGTTVSEVEFTKAEKSESTTPLPSIDTVTESEKMSTSPESTESSTSDSSKEQEPSITTETTGSSTEVDLEVKIDAVDKEVSTTKMPAFEETTPSSGIKEIPDVTSTMAAFTTKKTVEELTTPVTSESETMTPEQPTEGDKETSKISDDNVTPSTETSIESTEGYQKTTGDISEPIDKEIDQETTEPAEETTSKQDELKTTTPLGEVPTTDATIAASKKEVTEPSTEVPKQPEEFTLTSEVVTETQPEITEAPKISTEGPSAVPTTEVDKLEPEVPTEEPSMISSKEPSESTEKSVTTESIQKEPEIVTTSTSVEEKTPEVTETPQEMTTKAEEKLMTEKTQTPTPEEHTTETKVTEAPDQGIAVSVEGDIATESSTTESSKSPDTEATPEASEKPMPPTTAAPESSSEGVLEPETTSKASEEEQPKVPTTSPEVTSESSEETVTEEDLQKPEDGQVPEVPTSPEEHEEGDGQLTLEPEEHGFENHTTDEVTGYPEHQKPDQHPNFPVDGGSFLPGTGPDDDYDDQDMYGPGTCRYGGKVYMSAQQIPRDDPCDFCFCFRGDIICLQQSCPPPIRGCHEEPINGFCCPRYECHVSMANANSTTTTTTTTTTLPPHFLHHAYKGSGQRSGCQINGQAYRVGSVIKSASGPCHQCICGGDGKMDCNPRICSPEPMYRQMIAAATAKKRR